MKFNWKKKSKDDAYMDFVLGNFTPEDVTKIDKAYKKKKLRGV